MSDIKKISEAYINMKNSSSSLEEMNDNQKPMTGYAKSAVNSLQSKNFKDCIDDYMKLLEGVSDLKTNQDTVKFLEKITAHVEFIQFKGKLLIESTNKRLRDMKKEMKND